MQHSTSSLITRVRGGFVGAVSASVSIAAHSCGGGSMPGVPAAVLLIGVCSAIAVAVAGAPPLGRGLPPLGLALVAGQVGGHCALAAGMADQHSVHADLLGLPSGQMLSAHALAVLVCALLIAGVELALVVILAVFIRLIAPRNLPASADLESVWRRLTPRAARLVRLLTVASAGRRGPPIFA